MTIEVPHLGKLTPSSDFPEWLESELVPVPMLHDKLCRFILDGYEDDDQPEDFHAAANNLLAAGPEVLQAAEQAIYQYYVDRDYNVDMDEEDWIVIEKPEDVWEFVSLGGEFHLSRRNYGDEKIYASLECNCEWEEEHGLQIVLKEGKFVNKIGQYDGHVTNSDAYDHAEFEDMVYVDQEMLAKMMRARYSPD